jgi:hypothetical protein
MRSLLAIPALAGALLFTGCEATVVERRPVVEHRGYYDDRPSYYHHRPSYSSGAYDDSRYTVSDGYYGRSRASYRTGVNYRNETVVNRTNINRTNVNQTTFNRTNVNRTNVSRTNVNRSNATNAKYQVPAKKKQKGKHENVNVRIQG